MYRDLQSLSKKLNLGVAALRSIQKLSKHLPPSAQKLERKPSRSAYDRDSLQLNKNTRSQMSKNSRRSKSAKKNKAYIKEKQAGPAPGARRPPLLTQKQKERRLKNLKQRSRSRGPKANNYPKVKKMISARGSLQ